MLKENHDALKIKNKTGKMKKKSIQRIFQKTGFKANIFNFLFRLIDPKFHFLLLESRG